MALGFGSSFEQSMLGNTLSGSMLSPAQKNIVVVPVPVQAQPATKKSSSTSTSVSAKAPVANANPWPVASVTNFGSTPTYAQDAIPSIPQQPVWQENLSGFLGGNSLQQTIQAPEFQSFGMPVLDAVTAGAIGPDGYNKMLDTTKNNIAFNNKVAGDNYNNTLNIIRTLQQADQVSQEQYSRNLQNRNAVISGNKGQQDIAFTQSPQEQAGMKQQLANTTAMYHSQLNEKLQKDMAAISYKYQSRLSEAHDARTKKDLASTMNTEIQKKVIDLYGGVWKKAVEGLQPGDLDRYRKVASTGDSKLMDAFMDEIKNTSPVSAMNMKAAFNAQQILNRATGGAMGNIFTAGEEKPQQAETTMSLDEALKKYKAK